MTAWICCTTVSSSGRRYEEFVEDWKSFVVIRGQYTGHALRRTSTSNRPGELIPATMLGAAAREAGLWDIEKLLQRIQRELLPGITSAKREIVKKYPRKSR